MKIVNYPLSLFVSVMLAGNTMLATPGFGVTPSGKVVSSNADISVQTAAGKILILIFGSEKAAGEPINILNVHQTFAPGGYSGWHTHPGPVVITVKEGTMTFYQEDCTANVFTAGQGFIETGAHPHFARNETDSPATTVVTYLTPPSATVTRIDAPQPPTCMLP